MPTECSLAEPTMMVVPWHDPVVDDAGYDVRSTYVEMFWLNVLGPTSTWLLRRFVYGFARYPLGYEVDLSDTAQALGLTFAVNASNPFARAVHRLVMFGVAQPISGALAVRRVLPPVATRHLARMPEDLRTMHLQWMDRHRSSRDDAWRRATLLADVMVEGGDESDVVERQLLALGFSPDTAQRVASRSAQTDDQCSVLTAANTDLMRRTTSRAR